MNDSRELPSIEDVRSDGGPISTEGKGCANLERGNSCLPVGSESSLSLSEVRIFLVEPDSARGTLGKKQASSVLSGFLGEG